MDGLLVARAPLHIKFGGSVGGLARAYERLGGTAVSAAVRYYVYAIVSFSPLNGVQIVCGDRHLLLRRPGRQLRRDDSLLGMAGFMATRFNVRDGLTLFLAPQVAIGDGLGVVGSATVAVVKALAFCCGLNLEPLEVAEMAAYIEAKRGVEIAPADHYAAALGGINQLGYVRRAVSVEPLPLSEVVKRELESRLMLFSSDRGEAAPPTADGRKARKVKEQLVALADISQGMDDALRRGDLDGFGELLHRSWVLKGEVASRGRFLEECYRTARQYGALGGDWSGGPKGGFLVLYCPGESQATVAWAMNNLGLRRWPCLLADEDVQVVQSTSPVAWSSPTVVYSRMDGVGAAVRR